MNAVFPEDPGGGGAREYGARPLARRVCTVANHRSACLSITVIFTLPGDPALQRFDEAQLRLERACGFCAAGRISRGVGARIAGVDRSTFDEAPFTRRVPSFTAEIAEQDIAAWAQMARE